MRGISRRWWLLSVLAAVAIAAASIVLISGQRPAQDNGAAGREGKRKHDFPALTVDIPPIERPVLVPAADARIDDDAIIIGIVVKGEPRAYLRDAFALGPFNHILRDTIQSTPVAVTHCDRLLCTRVFASQDPSRPLNIRVGGWREDQTMDLIVNGNRFSQKSPVIPLADIPFSEATWGQWRQQHPDTLIYLGAYRDT